MTPRLVDDIEIKDALNDIVKQEDCDYNNLITEAVYYIDQLERLTVMFAKCMKDIDPKFVRIVEDNFWELLA